MLRFLGLDPDLAREATDWSLQWLSAWPMWVILLVVAAGATYVWQLYRREATPLSVRDRVIFTTLRVAAVIVLLLMIFEPAVVWDLPVKKDATLLVLVDDSKSMGLVDPYEGSDELAGVVRALWSTDEANWEGRSLKDLPESKREELRKLSRADIVNRMLADEGNFLVPLPELFNTRVYNFSDELREVASGVQAEDVPRTEGVAADIGALRVVPRGEVTRVGDLVQRAVTASRGRVAGVVIVTDGGRNVGAGLGSTAAFLKRRGIRAYAVGVGDATRQRDVALQNVNANRIVHVDDEVTVDFELESSGFDARTVTVKVLRDGTPVPLRSGRGEVSSVTFDLDGETLDAEGNPAPPPAKKCSLSFRAGEVGEFTYEIVAEPLAEERVVENNHAKVALRVKDAKIRVLYVEGKPRWEYRYLKNALVRDERIEVSCFLADADFDFPQEGNRSIQLVPTEERELAKYDVIILGDVPVGGKGFSAEHLVLFHKFVEKLGGGLLMQAGPMHAPREYMGTPIEKMLPVDFERRVRTTGTSVEWHPVLAPLGETHAMTRFEADIEKNRERWQSLPGFFWHYPVRRARPAGEVLLVHPTEKCEDGPMPLLATQVYGNGRTAFMAFDETWRWRCFVGDVYFMKFWGQVIRDLSQEKLLGTSKRFRVATERSDYLVGQKVKVSAQVLDRDFEPSRAAEVRARLESETGEVSVMKLKPVEQVPGRFEGEQTVESPGRYRVTLEVDEPGLEAELISHDFLVKRSNREFENPRMRRDELRSLAEITGGDYFDLNRAKFLPEVIRRLKAATIREVSDELWNAPILFTVFCLLFVSELGYRKLRKLL